MGVESIYMPFQSSLERPDVRGLIVCRVSVLEFFLENVRQDQFRNKRVLELGSKYVNGSIRPFIERHLGPKEYVGVDVSPGKFVDVVLTADELLKRFGAESFDVVVSTETLEHIADWRTAIDNLKSVLKSTGYIFLTTVRRGFPCHGFPYDFWRYEIDDLREIFADFEGAVLKNDHDFGISIMARKPAIWHPQNLESIELYSVPSGRRERVTPNWSKISFMRKITIRLLSSGYKWLLPISILAPIEWRYSGASHKELYDRARRELGLRH